MHLYFIIFVFLFNILTSIYSSKAPLLALESKDIEYHWSTFKVNHRRNHNSTNEAKRRAIFLKNLKKINELNKNYNNGNLKHASGINKFSDWVF